MKKLFITLAAIYCALIVVAAPNEKVLNTFKTTFPNAQSVIWADDNQSYVAYFSLNNIKCRLWYNADGVVIKSIRYYSAAELPPFIRSSVDHKYSDKKIFGVTEVTSEEGLEYNIVLEDETHWYDITSDGSGNISMKNKFKKA